MLHLKVEGSSYFIVLDFKRLCTKMFTIIILKKKKKEKQMTIPKRHVGL